MTGGQSSNVVIYARTSFIRLARVWPDWIICEWSCWQNILQTQPKYLMTLGAILQNVTKICLGNFLGIFGDKLGYF